MREIDEIRLRIPERDQPPEAFFDGSVEAFRQWTGDLPMVNAGSSARAVLDALQQIARLRAPVEHRFELLEIVRPVVHYLCGSLGRVYLRDSLILDEQEQRVASLTQSLQHQVSVGYKVIVAEVVEAGIEIDRTAAERGIGRCFASAIHRAISDASRTLLRSAQLYTPAPPHLWAELHRLYRIADLSGLLGFGLEDGENRVRIETSIGDAYRRALLLACGRPNKLRQDAIVALFSVLEDWSRFAAVNRTSDIDRPLFLVDVAGESAPMPTRALAEGYDEDDFGLLRVLDTTVLVHLLNEYLGDSLDPDTEATPAMPEFVGDDLVRHAVQAWGVLTKRAFQRFDTAGELQLCVGLSALHYHAAGGIGFEDQLRGGARRRSQDGDHGGAAADDRWREDFRDDTIIPRSARQPPQPALASSTTADPEHPVHFTRLADTSPGGYGVIWEGPAVEGLKTGVLLGVREQADHHWSIAVVRWLRQGGEDMRMGVELLAPRALPVGIRILTTRSGAPDWAPALELPELKVIDQPAMLITRAERFTARQKILINRAGSEVRAQLTQLGEHTDNYRQFEFRLLEQVDAAPDTGIEVGFVSEEEFWARIDADMDAKPASG